MDKTRNKSRGGGRRTATPSDIDLRAAHIKLKFVSINHLLSELEFHLGG